MNNLKSVSVKRRHYTNTRRGFDNDDKSLNLEMGDETEIDLDTGDDGDEEEKEEEEEEEEEDFDVHNNVNSDDDSDDDGNMEKRQMTISLKGDDAFNDVDKLISEETMKFSFIPPTRLQTGFGPEHQLFEFADTKNKDVHRGMFLRKEILNQWTSSLNLNKGNKNSNKEKQDNHNSRTGSYKNSSGHGHNRNKGTKTAGSAWFNMQSDELTPETKRDLRMLKLRRFADPKRFYKSEDHKKFPEIFQKGTVIPGRFDSSSNILTKREKRKTLVEEVLADKNVRQYAKRVFSESQTKRASGGKKEYKRLRNAAKSKYRKEKEY